MDLSGTVKVINNLVLSETVYITSFLMVVAMDIGPYWSCKNGVSPARRTQIFFGSTNDNYTLISSRHAVTSPELSIVEDVIKGVILNIYVTDIMLFLCHDFFLTWTSIRSKNEVTKK